MNMSKLFYISTNRGAGIREARGLKSALAQTRREVGYGNVKEVREASEQDIAWVRGMGGYVPRIVRGPRQGKAERSAEG